MKNWMRLLAALIVCLLAAAGAAALAEAGEVAAEPVEAQAQALDELDLPAPEEAVAFEAADDEPCAHESTYTYPDYTDSFTALNNRYHMITSNEYEVTVCDYCGQELSRVLVNTEKWDDTHDYDANGVCAECGHVNTCQHTHVEKESSWDWDKPVTYTEIPGDDRYHITSGIGVEWMRCYECGMEWDEHEVGEKTEKMSHYYVNGVCENCEHVNACVHANTREETYITGETTYVALDNKYHNATGTLVKYIYCEDCDSDLGGQEIGVGTLKWMHNYENGVCVDCGHVNTCTHPYASESHYFENETYVPVDNKYHMVTGTRYSDIYCNDCGQTLSETNQGVQTEKEQHYYNNRGVCEECGQVNTCQHTAVEEWTYWDTEQSTFTPVDNRYHSVTGVQYAVKYCDECGMQLSEVNMGVQTGTEGHYYSSNGVCEECGHVNTCAHANTHTYSDYENAVYTYVDENSHLVSGNKYQETYCEDCSMRIARVNYGQVTETEGHAYYERTGLCDCGAKMPDWMREDVNSRPNITGLWYDQNSGVWWLLRNGQIATDYTGLWCDANLGWWLVRNGSIAFDYTGLWYDQNVGWWLIRGGTIAFDYTGLWNDPNLGWWLIGNGSICFDYNGLWNDPNVGWWLIRGGSIAFDYTGLWCDPNVGWWLIGNGSIAFDYTGAWNDPNLGTWLIGNGTIAFGYTGQWNDPFTGIWQVYGGQMFR